MTIAKVMIAGLVGLAMLGCAGAPAAPFDTLKSASVIAFRLQNYEPPPSATPTDAPNIFRASL